MNPQGRPNSVSTGEILNCTIRLAQFFLLKFRKEFLASLGRHRPQGRSYTSEGIPQGLRCAVQTLRISFTCAPTFKRYIGAAIDLFWPAYTDNGSEVYGRVTQACSQRGPRVFPLKNFSTFCQKIKYYSNVRVTNKVKYFYINYELQ